MGEDVVMQTALVTIENPDNRAFKMETRVLLDTGSQRMYITKGLADELKLKTDGEDTCSVYTFGNGKTKELTSPIVSVTLTSKFGANISIKANVVRQITGIIQRTSIPIKERSFLQKHYELADSLPYNIQPSSLGILIGNDYHHDIIMKEQAEVQDGLHVIESKLGLGTDW